MKINSAAQALNRSRVILFRDLTTRRRIIRHLMPRVFARLLFVWVLLLVVVTAPAAQQRSIDGFFRQFSDGWVRLNPDLAVFTRYFTGEEQNRLEQQMTSYSAAAERQRLEYLRRGLAELTTFDRARLTDAEWLSADLLRYQ